MQTSPHAYHQPQQPHGSGLQAVPAPAGPAKRRRYRYRMRWDNLVIIVLSIAAIALLLPEALKLTKEPVRDTAPQQAAIVEPEPAPEPVIEDQMSLAEASRLVGEARAEMMAGRFDRASSLLSRIGGAVSDESGASTLRDENARRQIEYQTYSDLALAALAQQRWGEARRHLAAVKELAPLTVELAAAERKATRREAAARGYSRAAALFEDGRNERALKVAQAAQRRAATRELAQLIAQIKAAIASAKPRPAPKPAAGQAAPTRAEPEPMPGTTTPPADRSASGAGEDNGTIVFPQLPADFGI